MQQNRSNQIVTCYTTLMQAVERRIGDMWLIKGGGGLAWLLWQGEVGNNVVDRGTSNGVSLVVYRREEGEETMNTMQTDA